MNLKTLVTSVAEATALTPKQVRAVLDGAFQAMAGSLLQGETVRTPFGSFSVKPRAAKKGWNVHTNSPIKIPATKVVKFKPAASLKEAVSRGRKALATRGAGKKTTAKATPARKTAARKTAAAAKTSPKKTTTAKTAAAKKSPGRRKAG